MKLDFLNTVPYVCDRWERNVQADPARVFLTEEESGACFTRGETDELSARVYRYLTDRGIGAEDFVLIRLPRGAAPFIAMLGVWKAGESYHSFKTIPALPSSLSIICPMFIRDGTPKGFRQTSSGVPSSK